MKAEPPHKVVTDSLPQGLNEGLIKSAQGRRKLATVPRTLEPWVDPATAISMANEARKCARGEASASKSYLSPQDWPAPSPHQPPRSSLGYILRAGTESVCPIAIKVMNHEGQPSSGLLSSQRPPFGFEFSI